MRTCYILLFVLALLLTAVPAGAELRQWTDEHGVKHFSNKKELPDGVSVDHSYEEKDSTVETPARQHRSAPTVRPQPKPSQSKTKKPWIDRKKVLKEIQALEAQKEAAFERIYTKRRYVKRRGKQDIERIRRLDGEIKALEKSGSADPATLQNLKDDREDTKERVFNENLRTRKGVGEDIREYRQLEEEIDVLRKKL